MQVFWTETDKHTLLSVAPLALPYAHTYISPVHLGLEIPSNGWLSEWSICIRADRGFFQAWAGRGCESVHFAIQHQAEDEQKCHYWKDVVVEGGETQADKTTPT